MYYCTWVRAPAPSALKINSYFLISRWKSITSENLIYDLCLVSEKNWGLTIPGFSSEGQKCQKKPVSEKEKSVLLPVIGESY